MWFIWEQFHSECPTTILYNEFENKTFKTTATYATNQWVDTLRPRQNGCHLPDDIFKRIFLNENVWISLKISLKFVPKVPINNVPALVLIMAWCCPGDKPLSEPMMVSLLTLICVTRPQWVNGSWGHGWSGLVEPKRQDISISCKSINWLWGSNVKFKFNQKASWVCFNIEYDLASYPRCKICVLNFSTVQKFGWCLSSIAAEPPAKFILCLTLCEIHVLW